MFTLLRIHRSLASFTLLSTFSALYAAAPARLPAAGVTAPPVKITAETVKPLSWRAVGPANMGGRVSEIALVPGKSQSWFVATATGGLFKTENGGITFKPVFDDQAMLSIGSVAVAPSDEKIVYAGGGEGNGRNSSSWGDGIYKSTDGGDSFTKTGLPDSRDIPRLAIHPKNADIVYAAVMGHLWDANHERGLYKTDDGGKNWKPILQIDDNTGCMDVLLNPRSPETVYAVMYARRRSPWSFVSGGFGDKGGIYKSNDGGKSFARLTSGLPLKTGRIGLALYGANPDHLYALIEADDSGTVDLHNWLSPAGGVFKSEDGGAHWVRRSSLAPRSFYFGKITVDPKDETRIYVMAFALTISDDGGKTFRANGNEIAHGDFHSLIVDPLDNAHLLSGTDGGVYESWDRAKSWRYLDSIALGEFYELGLGMDFPYTICGGLQDNGTWCGPSRGRARFGESEENARHASTQDWFQVWGSDGYYAQIDPRDARIIYAEAQQGFAGRMDLKTNRFTFMHPVPKEGSPSFRFNWDSPLVLSVHDPDTLYLAGNEIFKYTRQGRDWTAISPDLSNLDPKKILTVGSGAENHGTVVALSESAKQKGFLWAGTDDGNLWLTRDEGAHWERLAQPAGLPVATWVSRIEASHFDLNTAYASFDGHRTGDNRVYLYTTRDSGKSWQKISAGLPEGFPVKVVREDPANANLLFCGSENGVYFSLDRGAGWFSLRGKSLPPVMVHDLQIHPREHDLVAGTHGRSIFILDDLTGLEQLTPEALAKSAVLFIPRPAFGFYLLDRGGVWGHNLYGVKNPPMGATLNYYLREKNDDGVKLEITDAAGHKVRELKGPGEAGLNRVVWDLQRDKAERIDPPEAQEGNPVFLPAGEYTVTMGAGKDKQSVKLTISYPLGGGPEE